MCNKTDLADLAILLRDACHIAARTDPLHAEALARQAYRILGRAESDAQAQLDQTRQAVKDARVSLRAIERDALREPSADVAADIAESKERAERIRAAQAEIRKIAAEAS